jgi:hypothetical protein
MSSVWVTRSKKDNTNTLTVKKKVLFEVAIIQKTFAIPRKVVVVLLFAAAVLFACMCIRYNTEQFYLYLKTLKQY